MHLVAQISNMPQPKRIALRMVHCKRMRENRSIRLAAAELMMMGFGWVGGVKSISPPPPPRALG